MSSHAIASLDEVRELSVPAPSMYDIGVDSRGFLCDRDGSGRASEALAATPAHPRGSRRSEVAGSTGGHPPVLLADASWYGTLAAARDLGSRGIPVIIAYDRATAPARWSRYASSTVPCPPKCDVDRFVEWLHEFGRSNPGCVLYPTSDDLAFLISLHHETLSPLFKLFAPSLDGLMTVLDKSRLGRAAERAELRTPRTWSPLDEEELMHLADDLPLPILIKPRAQILSSGGSKGIRVTRREDLVKAWSQARSEIEVAPQVLAVSPHLDRPVLQELHDVSESIYTLDGFADASGEIIGALACIKTLQMPRRSGSGVCFEPAEVDEAVLKGVGRLCRESGYVGVFDIEFAMDGDQKLLIDFNPRIYNHIAFEIDRGLPLPWLAYLSTMSRREGLREAAEVARRDSRPRPGIYVHRLPMRIMLAAQRASGGMTRQEVKRWKRWIAAHRGELTDPVSARRDYLPACVEVAHLLRNPRSLLRNAGR